ncbi:hypothetical protein IGI04_023314 [Brassica rapa subsp. trilocularis]|uniref:Uncharacterized protein n=1 Tax=Brassica rapa subsp. trilocularis TaxID=1813537 RepID=A0ABQ7M7P9_BRACM|nr:hypothetical protein IGI04_023314 [Brassica rapa subsp. trilocularis]
MFLMRQKVLWHTLTNSRILLSILILFISMGNVESGFIIRIYCFSLLQYGFNASREDLSCPETEISDSSILKETAAARLDAESLSKGSPTHVKSTSVWVLGGVWNWIINKKSRGSKMNFPNE